MVCSSYVDKECEEHFAASFGARARIGLLVVARFGYRLQVSGHLLQLFRVAERGGEQSMH